MTLQRTVKFIGSRIFETAVGVIVFCVVTWAALTALSNNIDQRSAYERALDSTVKITHASMIGSGTVLTSDGLIVTNAHVVAGVEEVQVTMHGGAKAKARVLWRGHGNNDVALIEVVDGAAGQTPWGRPSTSLDLDAAGIRTTPLAVGEKVFAVGHSRGHFEWSVAVGYVANVDRSYGKGFTAHSLQIDIGIHPGNSGGGLYDADGRLVGLVFAGNVYQSMYGAIPNNIGFVIPVSVLCRSAPCP